MYSFFLWNTPSSINIKLKINIINFEDIDYNVDIEITEMKVVPWSADFLFFLT